MNKAKKYKLFGLLVLSQFFMLVSPVPVEAMHIAEGFLPLSWCLFWAILCLPFLIFGIRSIKKNILEKPELKMLFGAVGAFAFVLSALKLPSVTGSSSHPTGIGLGAVLFGPGAMSIIGFIIILFQALLLAHGGITTLGANTFSMAIVGSLTAWFVYKFIIKAGAKRNVAIFLAAALADLATYVTTSLQLALAHPSEVGGIAASFVKFLGVFAITQIPLSISEGILTVVIFNLLSTYSRAELTSLSVLPEEDVI